jgi:hypothetical protein
LDGVITYVREEATTDGVPEIAQVDVFKLIPEGRVGEEVQLDTTPVTDGVLVVIATPTVKIVGKDEYVRLVGGDGFTAKLIVTSTFPPELLACIT